MRSWRGPQPKPPPPEAVLTLIRVGGSQDGTVLFLHLFHILGQFLDAASDLFHLGQDISDPSPRVVGQVRESGQLASAPRNGPNPEGQGVCRKEGVHRAKEVVGKGHSGPGLLGALPVQRTHP